MNGLATLPLPVGVSQWGNVAAGSMLRVVFPLGRVPMDLRDVSYGTSGARTVVVRETVEGPQYVVVYNRKPVL